MFRISALPFLLVFSNSCSLVASVYVANLSSGPLRIEYAVPCRPDCPSPTMIAVKKLRGGGTMESWHGSQPAPAVVRGRIDSTITYSMLVPPDTAVRLFDVGADAGGDVLYPDDAFRDVRLTAETTHGSITYEGRTLARALNKWHKRVHVLELK